ncbi:MAG TPA: hydrolase TatD, partial [Cryomorphaceae bacterium]|nr:hydrolase TatD [Cryomorphaceae bacterium]
MWIDTHCHLYDSSLVDRREEVQQRALAASIREILLPNIDVHSLPKMKKAVGQFPELTVRQMIGLHPCYVKEDYKRQLDTLKAAYESEPDRFCAVGEIGLDLYWDKTTLDIQIEALNTQLDWSVEWNLPIALHVRSSFRELL